MDGEMMESSNTYELYQKLKYIMQMRPVLKKQALFSDGTSDYRNPNEPSAGDVVTIRFRTARNNVDNVWLCVEVQQPPNGNMASANETDSLSLPMKKCETEGVFDYYEAKIKVEDKTIGYYFKIVDGQLSCYYDRAGVSRERREQYFFHMTPGFSTPSWAKGAVMYQILVDRFYNGDPDNDVKTNEYYYIKTYSKEVDSWNKYPANFGVGEFYGGDLLGVIKKLDYLQDLGIEVIYFNPLFVSPSNHKYDIQDYDYIDPHYGVILEDGGEVLKEGERDNAKASKYIARVANKKNLEASNQLFAQLVEEAHKRKMRVILDGVFNHCGSFNKWMDRERIYEKSEGYKPGAYIAADSPYHNFFHFSDNGSWPYNGAYDGWWGHDTLPKLNYEGSQELYNYILEIAKKWVSPPYNADGWRLDVAADLGYNIEFNHKFWRDFRQAVKEANPEAIIMAEHYGDPGQWLKGDEWDTVMNYDAFMEPLTWFLTGMEKHSDEYRPDMLGNLGNFEAAMNYYMTRLQTSSLQCAMNELSNHDHSRFLTRTNHKVGRVDYLGSEAASQGVEKAIFREAVVVQMTWPGAPTIYYGDEVGVCGFTDPDNRRTYPWGNEDKELLHFHKEMIRIHRENDALRTGSVKFLIGEFNLLCFGRFNRKQQFVIIVNNDEITRSVNLSVWDVGVPMESTLEQVIYTGKDTFSTMAVAYPVHEGRVKIALPPYAAVVLKVKDS
jgi:alpha-glucosidase